MDPRSTYTYTPMQYYDFTCTCGCHKLLQIDTREIPFRFDIISSDAAEIEAINHHWLGLFDAPNERAELVSIRYECAECRRKWPTLKAVLDDGFLHKSPEQP